MSQKDHYSFENGILRIHDEELGISIEEKTPLPLLPKKGKNLKILENEIWMEKDSQRHGQYRILYPSGKRKMEGFYYFGKLHGPSTYYSEQEKEKNKILATSWYISGKKVGKASQYYPDGQLHSLQRFVDGVWHGKQEFFYKDGTKKSILGYAHGALHGNVILYQEDGNLWRDIEFFEGQRKGYERTYSDNGVLLVEAFYEGDIPVDTNRRWHQNGILGEEVIFHGPPERYSIQQWNIQGILLRQGLHNLEDDTYIHRVWNADGDLIEDKPLYWDAAKKKLVEEKGPKEEKGPCLH